MNLFKINPQRILKITLVTFLAFGLTSNASAAQIKIVPGGLLVDGEPFVIKGVNYSPIPIGVDPETTPPFGDYFTANYSPVHDRDLPLMKDMGADTIRVWDYNHGADHTDFLNKAYNNGVRPIYVVLNFAFNPALYPDISSQEAREIIKADFRSMVAQYKNHPAILMWSIGNELNAPDMYGDRLEDLFTLINEMALEAHAEEGLNYHPVVVPLADEDLINTIATYGPLAADLDIWGANIYRGASFGTLFTEFRKVSTKPILVTGFGIDAYDETAEDEYENVGTPYQATYAESLWGEISFNSDVCIGGIIRSYSDEWWLGRKGNTLGGCPDDDPSLHSPCGHPSDSDPDGFINYEWFGIMRLAKIGSDIDLLEKRTIYDTLMSLWNPGGAGSDTLITVPKVSPSVKPLDLTRPPTNEEIMAAGQLGGQLYPTHSIADKQREREINLSFGKAIQAWNNHAYKEAVSLLKQHIASYPDSPWASEAILHIGCDAQYKGRYREAEESFRWIIEENTDKLHEGAKRLLNKARLRLGVLKVDQGNFKEAKELFATLKKEGSDWRDRTYASHWIQRLSRYTANQLSMLNCGTQALAYLLKKDGREQDARAILNSLPESGPGHSLKEVSEIASRYGYVLSGMWLSVSHLKDLPLPAIMHIQGKNQGDSGHYWILESVDKERLELFDPQGGFRFEQTPDQFAREWSGNALVFSGKENLPGVRLAENEMEKLYGGCCGEPRPEDGLGDPDGSKGNSCGSPIWKVNKINMNLFVIDTPFWYDPPIGPAVRIQGLVHSVG